ncbi:MAG: integration host factor subunit beta [Deltaproteobacteria bacterium]|nr:MAG: integration host factor subunit beta [Deltaproteobacteria bacterium]
MNKGELIDTLTNTLGITKKASRTCVESVFDSMTDTLVNGRRIEIRGFATFKVKAYRPYRGRNPKSGKHFRVAGKKLPHFKMCGDLKSRINRQRR